MKYSPSPGSGRPSPLYSGERGWGEGSASPLTASCVPLTPALSPGVPRERERPLDGFTLVELLVVLSILAVLFALTVGAVNRVRNTGYELASQSTLKTVKNLLERQWKTVADKADREAINPSVKATVDSLAAGDQYAAPRARVIYTKLRLKHAFPTSFAEVYTPYVPQLAMTEYQKHLTSLGITSGNYTSTSITAEQQNAICLLMILERGPGGGGTSSNELAGDTLPLGTSPTGKEVRGLVDGYRRPLILCRFPTGFAKLAAGIDPVDPERFLAHTSWANAALAASAIGHPLPATTRLQPVVASVGADGQLGLNPATFAVTNAGQASDNKYTTDY